MTDELNAAVARLKLADDKDAINGVRRDVRLVLAELERRDWSSGLCSKHQTPDKTCRLCAPFGLQLNVAEQERDAALEDLSVAQAEGVRMCVALRAERDAARAEVERLRAELASERAQWAGFVNACAQREHENDALRADLAKAQARCAELERQLSDVLRLENCINCICGRGKSRLPAFVRSEASAALASDSTSALAAVRLAQRTLRKEAGAPCAQRGACAHEDCAAAHALTEAFGSGE